MIAIAVDDIWGQSQLNWEIRNADNRGGSGRNWIVKSRPKTGRRQAGFSLGNSVAIVLDGGSGCLKQQNIDGLIRLTGIDLRENRRIPYVRTAKSDNLVRFRAGTKGRFHRTKNDPFNEVDADS